MLKKKYLWHLRESLYLLRKNFDLFDSLWDHYESLCDYTGIGDTPHGHDTALPIVTEILEPMGGSLSS